jgi:hypothetical protein
MAEAARGGSGGWGQVARVGLWSLAALLLLAPLVAMQVTDEVRWGPEDFVFAGLLFGTVGLVAEVTVRRTGSLAYRAGVAFALAAAFAIVWANAAVGIIGNGDNPYNLLFLGVVVLALGGAAAARFQPRGTALAMAAAGAAQAAVSLGGLAADPRGGEIAFVLAGLWLASAALFRKAARGALA